MKKFFISLISTIVLLATVLPSVSFAQEENLGVVNTISNENLEQSLETLNNGDLSTTVRENDTYFEESEKQSKILLAPIFRVILSAGKYISKMNRTGKVIKATRSVVATEAHIFSAKHLELGIMRLGGSRQEIVDKGIDIISRLDDTSKLKKGHNQIWTTINGHPAEIRTYVNDSGELLSFDMFYRTVSTIKPGANLILD